MIGMHRVLRPFDRYSNHMRVNHMQGAATHVAVMGLKTMWN